MITRWQHATGDRIDYAAFMELPDPFTGVSHDRFAQSIHLIQPDGEIFAGARAVFQALHDGAGRRGLLSLYRHVPLAAPIAEFAYTLVADHRRAVSSITRRLWGTEPGLARYPLTRWLFNRLIGLVYLIAFVSLGVQGLGLVP